MASTQRRRRIHCNRVILRVAGSSWLGMVPALRKNAAARGDTFVARDPIDNLADPPGDVTTALCSNL
jgi:hypothetical protein